MRLSLPRKRVILSWHRWLGILSAVFLLVVSLTGLALNHTETLGLDRIEIRSSPILARYGMSGGPDIRAYRIGDGATIAHLGGRLFFEGRPIAAAGEPLGIVAGDPITAVVTADDVLYLSPEGELIERLGSGQLPWKELRAVGRVPDGGAVFIANNGNWMPDAEWVHFEEYEGGYAVDPLETVELPAAVEAEILKNYQGGGASLYRVLLDLHSGRLFGWGGRTLMDLTAIAVILLVSSGIGGWLRKGRNQQPGNGQGAPKP